MSERSHTDDVRPQIREPNHPFETHVARKFDDGLSSTQINRGLGARIVEVVQQQNVRLGSECLTDFIQIRDLDLDARGMGSGVLGCCDGFGDSAAPGDVIVFDHDC